jgi:hypothetical protein
MKKLDSLIGKLETFESELFNIIETVIQENEAVIIEMNSEDQLFEKGVYRDGVKLDGYSPFTIEIKSQKGQPTNRTTLRDTGAFHESFYLEFQKDGFEMKASDPKTEELKTDWGPEILGLTDENLNDIIQNYVAPRVLIKLNELRSI